MRVIRVLVLLGSAAVAVAGVGAPNASAVSSVEVVAEASWVHCSPCEFLAVGEHHQNRLGSRVSTCSDTVEGKIYENGTGRFTSWAGDDHAYGDCHGKMCSSDGLAAGWAIASLEETAQDSAEIAFGLCIEYSGGSSWINCNVAAAMSEAAGHLHRLEFHRACHAGLVELEGVWDQVIDSKHPAIEVLHL